MSYTKKIVCLANSRKLSCRCIAGKEINKARYGRWIRPISNKSHGEVSEHDMRYQNGELPQLLDIISIRMIEPRPHNYQVENHLFDAEYYWEKKGVLDYEALPSLCDQVDTLGINGHSTSYGINDRIPLGIANDLQSSLLLIQPEELTIIVITERGFYKSKRRVRAEVHFSNQHYKMVVTDPLIEKKYLGGRNGNFKISTDDLFLCVSLGEPYEGYTYKLIAAIIEPD